MTQSTLQHPEDEEPRQGEGPTEDGAPVVDGMRPPGVHVAIIMDGNGRWASARGRPRTFGHREGAKTVRRVVEAAPDLGIGVLTLYAFSSDNWKRPSAEVSTLMRLFHRHLRSEVAELKENGVRLKVLGRRDRLPPRVLQAVEDAEATTADGGKLLLRLAVDYSARDALVRAARLAIAEPARARRLPHDGAQPHDPGKPSDRAEHSDQGTGREGAARLDRATLAAYMGRAIHDEGPAPDVDLLIRTGGEQRLSDFMLWESAYAELYFTDVMWPDFDAKDLARAVATFHGRERRFGGVPESEDRGRGRAVG